MLNANELIWGGAYNPRARRHGRQEYRLPRPGLCVRRHPKRSDVKSETAWQAGRGPHRILFGAMYEGEEIESTAFQGRSRAFCIASAGATALLLANEHEVVACDINPAQLAYAARRAAGGPFGISTRLTLTSLISEAGRSLPFRASAGCIRLHRQAPGSQRRTHRQRGILSESASTRPRRPLSQA